MNNDITTCPNCGNPIGENDDVCKYCGGDLSK